MAQLTQYAGTRYFTPPSFDPKSLLISALSLCLLLRTNDLAVAALAPFSAMVLQSYLKQNMKFIVTKVTLIEQSKLGVTHSLPVSEEKKWYQRLWTN